jgi:murein DD-endopeptidase MepM/ murein hydrolase activator NlpD
MTRGSDSRRPARRRGRTAARLAAAVGATAVLLTLGILAVTSVGMASPDGVTPPAGTYRPPLAGTVDVARGFEPPPEAWAAGHRGVDLRSTLGADVLAPVGGVVTYAGSVGGRHVVTVTDAHGRRSSVEPMAPLVRTGDLVSQGDRLGTVALESSHCAPAACVHWGVRVGTEYVDPLSLLPGAGPVVLLPFDDHR